MANLALGKTTDQSSTYSAAYPSSKVVDGNNGTFNHTNASAGEWWKVDLGSSHAVLVIRIRKNAGWGSRPQNYYIQTASDWAFTSPANIIIAISETAEYIEYTTVDFGSVTARYFRILCHTSAQYINLAEVEIWDSIPPTYTRITHALAEVLRDGDPSARITHALSEVLRDGIPKARITHALVEVLRASELKTTARQSSFFLVFPNF